VANFIVSGYKDIKINTLSDKEHYIIKADPYLLAQVFENIIINAIQAMDKKGNITISYSLHSNDAKNMFRYPLQMKAAESLKRN